MFNTLIGTFQYSIYHRYYILRDGQDTQKQYHDARYSILTF